MFGIGSGLTLDEFALWIYLRDVYWAEEGRSSLDAVVVATVIGGLIVLGVAPFDLPSGRSSVGTLVLTVGVDVAAGRAGGPQRQAAAGRDRDLLSAGLVGRRRPPGLAALAVGAALLCRRLRKCERSQARWARIESRRRRISDKVAGAPAATPRTPKPTEPDAPTIPAE